MLIIYQKQTQRTCLIGQFVLIICGHRVDKWKEHQKSYFN